MSKSSPDITFVCCIESGSLESQTVRMVQSLRRWGGCFAKARVVAVTPRLSPPLARSTRERLESCQIEHLQVQPISEHGRYSWNNFMNKPNAILAVDRIATTDSIAWLDSDLVFTGEPTQFYLQPEESFLACTSDRFGATTGPSDPLEVYWKNICQALGLDLESLPWVTTQQEQSQIRYYFNSGVFVYRRDTQMAQQYLNNCLKMLDARISSKECNFFFTDQIALGLTAFQLGLPWRSLPYSHNYPMGGATHESWYSEQRLRDAKIVHYHDAMWMPFWDTFLDCMTDTHPAVGQWLATLGPMQNDAPLLYRSISRALKFSRSRKSKAYSANCSVL
jgi:Glycosyl transferase family 8